MIGIYNLLILAICILLFISPLSKKTGAMHPVIMVPFLYLILSFIPAGIGTIVGVFEIIKKDRKKSIIGICLNAGYLIAFFVILITMLFHNYEDYGFKSIKKEFSWGVVHTQLRGEDRYSTFTAVRSSPYELFVSFTAKTLKKGTVKINELKLINAKDGNVVFKQNNAIENLLQKGKYEHDYGTYFTFKNIESEYEKMVLQMKFSITQGNQTTEYETEILFEKDYKKSIRIKGV